jgi:hypothetical protein
MLYAAYQPRSDILSQVSFTETNGGGCRLLVAVLSRYNDAFAVIGSSAWLIDVTDGYVMSHGVVEEAEGWAPSRAIIACRWVWIRDSLVHVGSLGGSHALSFQSTAAVTQPNSSSNLGLARR